MPPIVNCHRVIEVLWPKYHGLVKQALILHSLVKKKSCKVKADMVYNTMASVTCKYLGYT